jgi:hypothetical protein
VCLCVSACVCLRVCHVVWSVVVWCKDNVDCALPPEALLHNPPWRPEYGLWTWGEGASWIALPSEACVVLPLSFAGYRAIVSASTLAQCIGIDSTASGGQAQNRALVEQYIASVEAATAKMNEFRSALEEREYVNKRAETAHLVEEATAAVGRLDQCHANIKELQVAFRQMQARCEDGCAPYSHSCSQGTAPVCGPHHFSPPGVCVCVRGHVVSPPLS